MSAFESLLISFVSAHLLGDFVLQSRAEVDAKYRLSARHHTVHALKVALLTYALAGYWQAWWLIPVPIFAMHFTIDVLKMRGLKRCKARLGDAPLTFANKLWAFSFDQFLHVMALAALAWYLLAVSDLSAAGSYWVDLFGSRWNRALLLTAGLILTAPAGGCLVSILIEPFLSQINGRNTLLAPAERGFGNGGKVIGWLERGLIFLFVVTGQPTGVGFLVTAKSIFRFGELKDLNQRMEAEYIIIGTLMSFGWALGCSWLTVWAMRAS